MKKISKIKRLFVLCLIFLLSINSFAAVVSDNDGSTFVTKGEFDILKSNFSKQIDDYNDSIAGKISGAITSYLNGIRISEKPKNLYEIIEKSQNSQLLWSNYIFATGTAEIESGLQLNFERRHCYKKLNNITFNPQVAYTGTQVQEKLYYAVAGREVQAVSANTLYGHWYRKDAPAVGGGAISLAADDGEENMPGVGNYAGELKSTDMTIVEGTNDVVENSVRTMVYHDAGGGKYILRYLYDEWKPTTYIEAQCYTSLKDSGNANYAAVTTYWVPQNKLGSDTAFTITIDNDEVLGKEWADGTKVTTADYTKADETYYNLKTLLITSIDNSVDIETLTWGSQTNTNFYTISDAPDGVLMPQATKTVAAKTFYDVYMANTGFALNANSLSGATLKYNPLKFTFDTMKLHDFENTYISGVAAITTKHGFGAPLFEATDTEQDVKLKFNLEANKAGNIKMKISDKHFIDNDFDTTATIKNEYTYANGALVDLEFKSLDKGVYWVTINSETANTLSKITNLTIS